MDMLRHQFIFHRFSCSILTFLKTILKTFLRKNFSPDDVETRCEQSKNK